MYCSTSGSSFVLSARKNMRRSARRHTVRHTWAMAASCEPPGRMKFFCWGMLALIASIASSNRVISAGSSVYDGASGVLALSVAKYEQTVKRLRCDLTTRFLSSPSFMKETSKPSCELSSSTVPYASMRELVFLTLWPPTRLVVPSSPVLV